MIQRKLFHILFLILTISTSVNAQNIRYVSKSGAYTNDGKSWATAKINIQDAINDLVDNGLTGEVWVAKGTYSPTESTESGGGNILYLSFKIPAGIKVHGGFSGTETTKEEREKINNENMGWFYAHQTILTGDFSKEAEFKWNSVKKKYDTSFYGNCYHVVWFATNGFDSNGRGLPLDGEALLEGCIVKDGNAKNSTVEGHPHNAYGGGIYMVEGAKVTNCHISHCEASRNGGGVYMDGGGKMEHCFVVACQSLGIAATNGFGGGVCIDTNNSEKSLGISRSIIASCVARMGGGLAINVNELTSPNGKDIRFKPYASATVIANNTATTEGGGVYLNRGGAITQMTIVRNRCDGVGVTSNNVTTGRAAGLYCRDKAYILNSVIWGGECPANDDIQYATSRSVYDDNLKVIMKHCSLSKSDFVDWSGTKKLKVLSLSMFNSPTEEADITNGSIASNAYPMFSMPSPKAGYVSDDGNNTQYNYQWKVGLNSSLLNVGILPVEIDQEGVLPFGETEEDVTYKKFYPRSTLGAYSFTNMSISPNEERNNVNYYVDSNPQKGSEALSLGFSWDHPLPFLSDALYDVKRNAMKYQGKTVNIYVKAGKQYNTNSFVQGRIRLIPLEIPSNVNIYGGYPCELTGTHLEQEISGNTYRRNPLRHPTIIMGNITTDYETNVAHLITFNNSKNVVFDGFQVRYANASSTLLANEDKNGAGMTFLQGAQVKIRNTIIAGCTAEKGAAIYASGACNLEFENCIIHNNASSSLNGIIYSEGKARLSFNHCDFLRNVGYVSYLEGQSTKQTYTNSIFFGNMDNAIDNTNQESGGGIDHALPAFAGNTKGVSGSYCMFDKKSASFSDQFGGNQLGEWQYNLQYTFSNGAGSGYPRFLNPTKNTGVSPDGDITFNGSATSFEPHNGNPMVNAANHEGDHTTWGTDISTITTRDYGGLPDIGAVENHKSTKAAGGENAYEDGQPVFGGVTFVRDYNTYTYDTNGNATLDTSDLSTEGRDGSSWAKAINGNASYNFTTTTINYPLSKPISSNIANPQPYKLGMLSGNNINNPVYYAKNISGDKIRNTLEKEDGDDFIFIQSGNGYYIYNLTKEKYVCYKDAKEGKSKIYLSDSNTSNALWRLKTSSTNPSYLTYLIQPQTTSNISFSPSWNFMGGVENDLGLYRGTDSNSNWQFFKKDVQTNTVVMNGLQYAVNNAEKQMAKNYTKRITTQTEKYASRNKQTTHTYYDFTPTSQNPLQEVWVGAGIYTNPKGYVLRNHVQVFGAFPKLGNPGKDQRHPQLTEGISLSRTAAGVNIRDYETILQTNANILERDLHKNDVSVLSQPEECRVTENALSNIPANRVIYEGAIWDGFTLRYGYKSALPRGGSGRRDGGAGVRLYENAQIVNCVIRDNLMEKGYGRGSGIYVDGSTIINCYIMNNLAQNTSQIYGGGLYMIKGTIYNSVITGNDLGNSGERLGAGAFFESADFYNNTVANNKNGAALGVWTASADDAHLTVYNSIVMGGDNKLIDRSNSTPITFKYSFLQSSQNAPNDRYFKISDYNQVYCGRLYNATIYHPFAKDYTEAITQYDFRLTQKDNYNAVNSGTQFIDLNGDGNDDITLPEYDMDYSERVQDCEVDIGAFEYNGAYSIAPDITTVPGQAIFYVSPSGRGNASANSPAHAACSSKLQKVLDSAGRYKYLHPEKRVIVKVANSKTLEETDTPFKYYATRTTYEGDQDVRIWSIIVPRGIEIWGGYTDEYKSDADNGFYSTEGGFKDRRNIIAHPTYFDAYYYNKRQKVNVYTYHVLTFTDKVFDGEGLPYMEGDRVGENSSFSSYLGKFISMTTKTSDRAIVDGIFITGGNANLRVRASGVKAKNINQFGGAAIVTDYAHIRNCILRNNEGVYGGALALTHKALVSGCLLDKNTADFGGAIYVLENGTDLSDGTKVNTTTDNTSNMAMNMAHVYTSTIVNNKANIRGGGIWFGQDEANVRINSTAVWQNESQDQANISGLSNPEKPSGSNCSALDFYPFSYCATQNIRLSGTNNINLRNLNREGVRFAKNGITDEKTLAEESNSQGFNKFNDFGYYAITSYSVLTKAGMTENEYEQLKNIGLSEADFAGTNRYAGSSRTYIDIGARAVEKNIQSDNLMLRLFVTRPEDIDMNAAEAMMSINTTEGSPGYDADKAYYAQEGSSFAYPMQSIQDALDYIRQMRSIQEDGELLSPDANNLPFEICVSRGVYYPTRDVAGSYGNALDNTFLIPEGVSIIGGFNGKRAVKADGTETEANNFYGRYNIKGYIQTPGDGIYDLQDNITQVSIPDVTITNSKGTTYVLHQQPIEIMTKNRERIDLNANNIIEPWEFVHQTTLSGNVYNISEHGVLHVISIFPDQVAAGALPYRQVDKSATYQSSGDEFGYTSFEVGQPVKLDGLTITGGYAGNYIEGALEDEEKFFYYHGGGILIDGDRYCDDFNRGTTTGSVYKHTNVANAIAYRDIPLVITKCKFENNHAGYGAAISANTSLSVYSSSFEHNIAEAGKDDNVSYQGKLYDVAYPGHGGAIYSTCRLIAFNTIFANNEAYDKTLDINPISYHSLRTQIYGTSGIEPPVSLGGCGGAVYSGKRGYLHLTNCNFVHNMANAYPAVFTMNPNKMPKDENNSPVSKYSQIINTLFWGNEVNEDMKKKWNDNPYFSFSSQLICNYGKYDRDGNYNPSFQEGNVPLSQEQLNENYKEMAWFCAYENERGITQVNKSDLREVKFNPLIHIELQLKNANKGKYQNCNLSLSGENNSLEGPNFVNPSREAGYAGYMESADWSPARLNKLTDNGSGKILQKITRQNDSYKAEFATYTEANEIPPERAGYSTEQVGDYITAGAYTTSRYLKDYPANNMNLPIGADDYMTSAYVQPDGTQQQLYRISYDPNPTHNHTYIDIGVYEYPHTELQYATIGDEVDVLWVSPTEKPENGLPDGSAWSQPTSDLQRAIETLLSSRNGHRKEIRLLDGTYTPTYKINNRLAFTIDTRKINESSMLPLDAEGNPMEGYGVKSLTIKGGYSRELNNVYDTKEYPAVIRQQNRADATSNTWNHLIYIADATQRYGQKNNNIDNEYGNDTGYGWWAAPGINTSKIINTIPIEIDGIRLINNQALSNTKGTTICYADQKFDDQFNLTTSETPTYKAKQPTSANLSKVVYYKDDTFTEVSDVPTSDFKREGQKYYTDGTYTTETSEVTPFVKYGYVEKENPAKLILSKTIVMNSGTHHDASAENDKSSSAVYIGKNGGTALLYNDVLHSNYGDPIQSECQTMIINSTIALNSGLVDITGGDKTDKSVIYNSVFWCNNPMGQDTFGKQFNLINYTNEASSGDIFKYNAFTGGNMEVTDYTAGGVVANHFNVGLSNNNSDVINGPNFLDPENTDIESRNFSINPSLRLLNKGKSNLYNDNLATAFNVYDIAWLPTTRHDAGSNARFVFDIDLGAYEYQNELERVIYVNPNSTVTGRGNSWASPLGHGNLQTAVDLAAVYHVNNPTEEAYVFVKGASATNAGLHTDETLILRNGVSVFGGISPTYTVDCKKTDHSSGVFTFEESVLKEYVTNLLNKREGIVSTLGSNTKVKGIKIAPNSVFDTTNTNIVSLADGFVVTAATNANPKGIVTSPVIDIRPSNAEAIVALRNIVVHHNDLSATSSTNIAIVDNALLYEALFHHNKVANNASVLKIGNKGYAVNITAEGKTTGADDSAPYNGSNDAHIYYSLVNYAEQAATENTLSGYNYPVSDANLNYQLTEQSKHIDECPTQNPIEPISILSKFINYTSDRDLLGNPRLLRGVSKKDKIDRGAFETWKIDYASVKTTDEQGFYPHDGSVVYIMEDNSLVSGHSLVPSYLLLKTGSSLYGEGNNVQAAYLAVERQLRNGGAIVSFPYPMNYNTNVTTPSYDDDGVLTLTNRDNKAYTYNGSERANWNYHFMKSESTCWDETKNEVDANNGVLYAATLDATYRFTGKGVSMKDYLYTEMKDADFKTVTLQQNDDRLSTAGGADFTSKEDMGWNCFGIPYLVSSYKSYEKETFTGNNKYNMDIPHTLWLYYDGKYQSDGTTLANGDGGFYSVSSWKTDDWHLAPEETPRIWVGEGIFTQTTVVSNNEELTFFRPSYNFSENQNTKKKSGTRLYVGDRMKDETPMPFNVKTRGHIIYITGLQGNEEITIYDSSGKIYNMTRATHSQYSTAVPINGVFIVKIDNYKKKILIR